MRRKRIKQTQLAAALNISHGTVHKTILRGQPSVSTCERYAEALGVSLPELIKEGYYS
ncbi:helix-turn-helix domain-containing protein [Erwinia phyllosphaerae]|uniref:helix-turn-helix domain-containing protein n=1 Tax=Erwinia phyllosphaerae TaxID=2853256 RepID=UPI003CCF7C6C